MAGGLTEPLLPRPDLRAAAPQDVHAHRHDEPRLLGRRDELTRRDQPAPGVLPPYECFEAFDRSRPHGHDRLVVDDELVSLHAKT